MQFSAAAVLAFVASAVAQLKTSDEANPLFNPIYAPAENEEVTAGTTTKIEWTTPEQFADVKVTIELIGGKEQNLQSYITTVATGVANSAESYDWTIPSDIGGLKFYGLKIISEANPDGDWQYSNPFNILVNPDAATASETAASTTTVTTASGTATVTLSVASVPSSTTAISTSSEVVSSSAVPESSSSVVETTVVTTLSTVTSTPVADSTESTPAEVSESAPALVDESGAGHAKAGILALAGGLAVALML